MTTQLEEQSIAELRSRVVLGSSLIKMLYKDDDPRAASAIENLQEQQRQINKVLVAKIQAEREKRGEPEPPPIVVGCQSAMLSAKAKGSPALQVRPSIGPLVVGEDGSTTFVLQYI